MNNIGQVFRLCVQVKLARFNTTHVKHIVDKRKQMVRRKFNLSEESLDLFLVANVHGRQFRITDNSIHRSADIMAHVVEEHRLCTRCRLSHFKRLFKSCLLRHFLAVNDIVIEKSHKHSTRLRPVAHLGHLHTIPFEPFISHSTIILEERIFMLQSSDNCIPIKGMENQIHIVLIDNLADIFFSILKEVNTFSSLFIYDIFELSARQRNAKQARIDIDIEHDFVLIRKAHDTFNVFLMFRFCTVLGIHFNKSDSDKLWRNIDRFCLGKYKTRILVFCTIEVPKYNSQAFLVHELSSHKLSRSKANKLFTIIRMCHIQDKCLKDIFQPFASSKWIF